MTQEERDILIADLCGRLPYGVKIKEEYGDYINVNIHNAHIEHLIDRVASGLDKLVLRPMSSMTEEEEEEWWDIFSEEHTVTEEHHKSIDWLNKNMFDYRGLIPKGLALEDMYDN